MHAFANASGSSMYILVNLLAYFFRCQYGQKKKKKVARKKEEMRGEEEGEVEAEEE